MPTSPALVMDSVISRPVIELMHTAMDRPIGIVIEVVTNYPGGVSAAARVVEEMVRQVQSESRPVLHTAGYVSTALTADEIQRLVQLNREAAPAAAPPPARTHAPAAPVRAPRAAIYRIWPNFEVRALIYRSVITTKCDAARRAFDATGHGIVWAVMDSGIDANHAHFQRYQNVDPAGPWHRSFVSDDAKDALVDEYGHGTHVAGIIAGGQEGADITAAGWYLDENQQSRASTVKLTSISGMAPLTSLVSLKVLRSDGTGDLQALLAALRHIQDVNDNGRNLVIHGVNISVGYPFDPSWFATGLTPVCREVDLLVKSGVVVVVAAGNTGYGTALDFTQHVARVGFAMTIQDPGNADLAVTVGATSSSPHSTGVAFFSSKGPTGDGRLKPDLVAPGERVISAAAGGNLKRAQAAVPGATYVEDSGTSMAAPHVSGTAAAFLSVHREYLGQPEDVKRILMDSATDLGRARTFQGAGLVDAMRSIQAV
ncbi:MAG TPA: S8 family peptidase [Kineosporiaceae bacterium]|nr:S8 family peptidase [Kineosporiaceae bacterium]